MYIAILEVVELINVHTFALSLDILCQPTGPVIQIQMVTTFQPLQQSMTADCQKSDTINRRSHNVQSRWQQPQQQYDNNLKLGMFILFLFFYIMFRVYIQTFGYDRPNSLYPALAS